MAGGWLRLVTDVNYYVMLDSPYYGFGNDTSITDWTSNLETDDAAYENLRTYNHVSISEPQHNLLARMTVSDNSTTAHKKRLEVLANYSIQYKNIEVYDNSKLAADAAAGLDQLHGTDSHWLLMCEAASCGTPETMSLPQHAAHSPKRWSTGPPASSKACSSGMCKPKPHGSKPSVRPSWFSPRACAPTSSAERCPSTAPHCSAA